MDIRIYECMNERINNSPPSTESIPAACRTKTYCEVPCIFQNYQKLLGTPIYWYFMFLKLLRNSLGQWSYWKEVGQSAMHSSTDNAIRWIKKKLPRFILPESTLILK